MPASHVNDSKHWRDRAAQMRALSEMMKDIDAATIMLRLADDYDILADRADARSNGGGAVHWWGLQQRKSFGWRVEVVHAGALARRVSTCDRVVGPQWTTSPIPMIRN
jgi:hypothetical protein